jgi:hypothetical protein
MEPTFYPRNCIAYLQTGGGKYRLKRRKQKLLLLRLLNAASDSELPSLSSMCNMAAWFQPSFHLPARSELVRGPGRERITSPWVCACHVATGNGSLLVRTQVSTLLSTLAPGLTPRRPGAMLRVLGAADPRLGGWVHTLGSRQA